MRRQPPPGPGPLESLRMHDYCQMCGDRDKGARHRARLEPAFDPSGHAKTLCYACRIGAAELRSERSQKMLELVGLISRMKTEQEFGDNLPESEDWIMTINQLIQSARSILGVKPLPETETEDL